MTNQAETGIQIPDRPALETEITPEMIEAGTAEFVRWFERDEHQEALVELPSEASIGSLLASSFAAMRAAMPVSTKS